MTTAANTSSPNESSRSIISRVVRSMLYSIYEPPENNLCDVFAHVPFLCFAIYVEWSGICVDTVLCSAGRPSNAINYTREQVGSGGGSSSGYIGVDFFMGNHDTI